MEILLFGTDLIAIRRYNSKSFRSNKLYTTPQEIPDNAIKTSKFMILSGKEQCKHDFLLLCQIGVNPYCISFYENFEWRKGCSFLGQFLWFGRSYYRSCVYRRGEFLNIDYSGNILDDFKRIQHYWHETINHWRKNEPTPCDGCVILKEKLWPRKTELKSLSLYGGFKGERCNFHCCYCDAKENLKKANEEGITMVDAINTFLKINNKDLLIALSAGEITVSPYKDDIFSILRANKIKTSIFSNGLIYDDSIYISLRDYNGSLNISLDAGTQETFYKIKGSIYYQKVIDNISKYSESNGKIELKYIFLEGINDNINDVNGFLAICEKYATSVRVSCNKFQYKKRLSNNTFVLIQHIIDRCKSNSLPLAFSFSQFNDLDSIKIQELIENN